MQESMSSNESTTSDTPSGCLFQVHNRLKQILRLALYIFIEQNLTKSFFSLNFQSEFGKKKGDFVFQTGHVIEIVTKLFLVIQNATSKPPEIHISTEFEANFGQQTVVFTFKCGALTEMPHSGQGQTRVARKGNRMEVII